MPYTSLRKVDLSFTSRTIIILILLITFSIFYFTINNEKSSSSMASLISSFTSSSSSVAVNGGRCRLSMKESDNWFCQSDSDWKRRKTLHHIQDKRNRISDSRPLFFQNNWEPTIQCEFERRLGNTGDGGKWVCDIHRFGRNNTKILVYSFGSNGDFSFERAIQEQFPKAEIHTFDLGVYQCPANVCTFHQVRLGNGKNDSSKSFQTIVNDLGHQRREIHLLKVDIEGSEYNLFEEMFRISTDKTTQVMPYVRQILFEIHLPADRSEVSSRRAHQLFELFRVNNYAIFHKEANLYDSQNVFEYGLLHLNRAFFIAPS
ncbi:unnamed protein product [Rotaria socialis]|uniref:Methyltransferase domain-containing protein n=1 Tax=Rotaria socialis TaxID=392032 RepID=A0A818D758_9BILA|nr:unnamed protein product [Rotaria socialis]CAF3436789.1 unnamed protein product [Rotaria socialis]CAF3449451.1 unnamed protein product [Rotaria socialis]CAF3463296.1 unnamed protein product [Rotaria socialis]CAF3776811.1 unnamed protein product [Rotaria socialis]